MIEVKLTFDTLQQALQTLTRIELPDIGVKFDMSTSGVTADEKVAAAAVASAPAPRAKKSVAAPPAPEPEKTEAEKKPEPEAQKAAPTIDYDRDLKPKATKLIGINPEAFKKICSDMGVATFKTLPPERWADALAKTEAALEELAESV